MTIVSTILVIVLGLLLGLVLYSLGRQKKASSKFSYTVVSIISNIFRSTPFMILMVLLIPFTTMLVGTMLGAKAAIPALVLSAVPFYARLVEIALREVDAGVIEAAEAMGASYWQVVYKVLIPESIPALISGITVTTITMIGYTAMAGTIGAGGLGSLAWQEGFQRGNYTVTMVATVIILVIVFIVQAIGDTLTKQTDKR
jgi:D-methionine transport system permease protein